MSNPVPIPTPEQLDEAAILEKFPSLRRTFETGEESHDGREAALLSYILTHPSLPTLKSNPPALLAAIDSFSYTHDFLISVGPQKAQLLSSLLTNHKPKITLELGGYLGYSAILFAHTMKLARPNEPIHVWSLELNESFAQIARQLIALAGLEDCISVLVGEASSSLTALESKHELTGTVDFLFLDHVEELYVQDFETVERLGLLSGACMVVADNVVRPGAPAYRSLMRGKEGWRSEGVKALICPGDFEDEFEVSYHIAEKALK